MKKHLSTYDIEKDSTNGINTHFQALWTGAQCIKPNLNCDTFDSIKIVIDVIIKCSKVTGGGTRQNPTVCVHS